MYILHPEERTLVITASALIKAVTNVLPLTKTLDAFDVEERNAEYLENQCPNVTVIRDAVERLDAKEQAKNSNTKSYAFAPERFPKS